MSPKVITSIGLFLDIIGVLIVWRFGLPTQEVRRGGHNYLVAGVNESERDRAARYDWYARGGFFLIITGFLFQLVGAWISQPQ